MTNSLFEHFRQRQDAIAAEIAELVSIESPSNDVAASGKIVDLLTTKFRAAAGPASIERIKAEDVGEHLIVRVGDAENPAERTLILGHTDTVHPTGTLSQNPIRTENGRLYGPGTFDMKANIPIVLEAFRYLCEENITRQITVLLSCDEETGSATGRELVEREAARSSRCFVLEPSDSGRVKTGRKGTGVFHLEAHGLPAHAGLEPERGANAVAELARCVSAIHALADRDAGTTVNVTTFSGGTATNVIPAFAVCDIDVRFSRMAEGERVGAELAKMRPSDERVKFVLKGQINRPPLEETAAVLSLYEHAKATAASIGFELGRTRVGGASDGNFVAALGIPVLDGLGISGDGAHTLEEYVEIDDIPRRAALLTALLIGE
ncbi:MAG: peptidase M20 [Acidobacteria bacterium OLB17]|nr:MAG: peptidase M20 [Acidobacteria bacterium OLB17]MCZ2390625.1 M20 family metallopeptidase [Acidobacteriota bacterium]